MSERPASRLRGRMRAVVAGFLELCDLCSDPLLTDQTEEAGADRSELLFLGP